MDEPALREGLPLKREQWDSYLKWAVDAFRLSTAVAQPATQIVTHLCYSEFADILPAIDRLDGALQRSQLYLFAALCGCFRYACAGGHAV